MSQQICIASDSLLIGEAVCKELQAEERPHINLFFYERDLLRFVADHRDALIVLLSRLKDVTTNDLLEKIRKVSTLAKVVVIDSCMDRLRFLMSTKKDLCKGLLFHDIGCGELLYCLSEVTKSREYISSQLRINHHGQLEVLLSSVDTLSMREKEIFDLIGLGYASNQICEKLFISSSTINNHKTSICTKLNVTRRCLYTIAVNYNQQINKILK